ncbi:MAG: thiamine/molybdopterin biosynthesis protein, partial [Staphylococcus equorum]|nr:thiamine/molybdopterin biosynthesis protein [Staphylococcus equorum]
DYQITLFKDGRMNVYGIENEDQAVELYEEFLKCLK